MRTSCDSFRKAPNINIGPNDFTSAGKIDASFFLALGFAKSTLPESLLNDALVLNCAEL